MKLLAVALGVWLLTSTASADSDVSVSILSILKPQEVTVTLMQPDRAVLRSGTFQKVIGTRKPIAVQLAKNALSIDGGEPSSQLFVECTPACSLELGVPGLTRTYSGNLRLTVAGNTINIVLLTSQEELLGSIVASEMGESREPHALQAFAIVSRTFLNAGRRHPELNADFCDLTHCQVFQSFAPTPEATRAVKETEGLLLTYRQKPFRPFYFRNCGGATSDFESVWKKPSPDYPFTSVKCDCNTSWQTTLDVAMLQQALGFPVTDVQQADAEITFTGPGQVATYSLEEFRTLAGRALGWKKILSNSYVVTKSPSGLLFEGHGIGHRVGLCQNGASRMARRGFSFPQILQHYLPNTEIRQ